MTTPELSPEDEQFYYEYVHGIFCPASSEFVRRMLATTTFDKVEEPIQPVMRHRHED